MSSETNIQTLRSRRVLFEGKIKPADIYIERGMITDVDRTCTLKPGAVVTDFGSDLIMPGVIDCHTHINEPGRTEWEGFESATKAAAAGGITLLVDMPLNSSPVTISAENLQTKVESSTDKLWVDTAFYGGVIPSSLNAIPDLILGGVVGLKAFMVHSGIDEFPATGERELRHALKVCRQAGIPLLAHAEVENRANAPENPSSSPRSYTAYMHSRPPEWELEAIRMLIKLCEATDARVHIVHLSAAEALPEIEDARKRGLPLTVETCPHYLCFSSEEIADGDTRFKCAPPIRSKSNRERLWQALGEGIIDFIASDHSPCPPEMKNLEKGEFPSAWGGISSLQIMLPVVWSEASRRGFGLADIARWLCDSPARFLGLGGKVGRIAKDTRANIVVWKPEEEFTVQGESLHHRHKLTPYEGRKLKGVVHSTMIGGRYAYLNGTLSEMAQGHPVLRRKVAK
jgi:allantoinase